MKVVIIIEGRLPEKEETETGGSTLVSEQKNRKLLILPELTWSDDKQSMTENTSCILARLCALC